MHKIIIFIIFILIFSAYIIAPAIANDSSTNSISTNSENNLNDSINRYKVWFDKEPVIYTDIALNDGHYYLVRYDNYIPFTSGYQIFYSNGTIVNDPDKAKYVLQIIAWTEGVKSVDDEDIQSLNYILNQTKSINQTISPVVYTSNLLVDFINFKYSLKKYGLGNDIIINIIIGLARGSNIEYDVIVYGLNNINNQLNDVNNATYSLNTDIPTLVNNIECVKNGNGYATSNFNSEITQISSEFNVLQNKISSLNSAIDSVLTVGNLIVNLEKFSKGLVGSIPIIGGSLQSFINDLIKITNDINNAILTLKIYGNSLSDKITLEQNTLNKIVEISNQKSNDYMNGWDNRHNLLFNVLLKLFVTAIILVIIVIAYLRYKNKI